MIIIMDTVMCENRDWKNSRFQRVRSYHLDTKNCGDELAKIHGNGRIYDAKFDSSMHRYTRQIVRSI